MSDKQTCGNCEWWVQYYDDLNYGACKNSEAMACQMTDHRTRIYELPQAHHSCEHWESRKEVEEMSKTDAEEIQDRVEELLVDVSEVVDVNVEEVPRTFNVTVEIEERDLDVWEKIFERYWSLYDEYPEFYIDHRIETADDDEEASE